MLAGTPADLLACETIPSFPEAEALATLMCQTPERQAWISFQCRDEYHIADGTPIADCGRLFDATPNLFAIGANCTAPRFIPALIRELRSVTNKPIIVYPNSGETFEPATKTWCGTFDPASFAKAARTWVRAAGNDRATLVGGCCRTTPSHIRALSETLRKDRHRS